MLKYFVVIIIKNYNISLITIFINQKKLFYNIIINLSLFSTLLKFLFPLLIEIKIYLYHKEIIKTIQKCQI